MKNSSKSKTEAKIYPVGKNNAQLRAHREKVDGQILREPVVVSSEVGVRSSGDIFERRFRTRRGNEKAKHKLPRQSFRNESSLDNLMHDSVSGKTLVVSSEYPGCDCRPAKFPYPQWNQSALVRRSQEDKSTSTDDLYNQRDGRVTQNSRQRSCHTGDYTRPDTEGAVATSGGQGRHNETDRYALQGARQSNEDEEGGYLVPEDIRTHAFPGNVTPCKSQMGESFCRRLPENEVSEKNQRDADVTVDIRHTETEYGDPTLVFRHVNDNGEKSQTPGNRSIVVKTLKQNRQVGSQKHCIVRSTGESCPQRSKILHQRQESETMRKSFKDDSIAYTQINKHKHPQHGKQDVPKSRHSERCKDKSQSKSPTGNSEIWSTFDNVTSVVGRCEENTENPGSEKIESNTIGNKSGSLNIEGVVQIRLFKEKAGEARNMIEQIQKRVFALRSVIRPSSFEAGNSFGHHGVTPLRTTNRTSSLSSPCGSRCHRRSLSEPTIRCHSHCSSHLLNSSEPLFPQGELLSGLSALPDIVEEMKNIGGKLDKFLYHQAYKTSLCEQEAHACHPPPPPQLLESSELGKVWGRGKRRPRHEEKPSLHSMLLKELNNFFDKGRPLRKVANATAQKMTKASSSSSSSLERVLEKRRTSIRTVTCNDSSEDNNADRTN
ncbi:uncharacterized protein [Ptychodera flava]|uniref:uncharacterized protein n=1 Tax=Ptychodera flava TaxID=63121 RepID=UPI00396A0529